ncbi:MAG: hypothetical protein HYX76_01925 [Acidobacteria bacterium]|nr:hypothetical protein [Acidobacteriota bacterium]
MEHPPLKSFVVTPATCMHLRHKGMYVTAARDTDEHAFYDRYDATAYWCTRTQKARGPDGRLAHADTCTAGRDCCEP